MPQPPQSRPQRYLPDRPDLIQLRHQARDLQRAAAHHVPEALERIRAVSPRVTLSAAQLALARAREGESMEEGEARERLRTYVQHRTEYQVDGDLYSEQGHNSWVFKGTFCDGPALFKVSRRGAAGRERSALERLARTGLVPRVYGGEESWLLVMEFVAGAPWECALAAASRDGSAPSRPSSRQPVASSRTSIAPSAPWSTKERPSTGTQSALC